MTATGAPNILLSILVRIRQHSLQKTNTFFHLWGRLRPRAAQGDALAARERGFDAARKIVGRKRHVAVDTDGRLATLRREAHALKAPNPESMRRLSTMAPAGRQLPDGRTVMELPDRSRSCAEIERLWAYLGARLEGTVPRRILPAPPRRAGEERVYARAGAARRKLA